MFWRRKSDSAATALRQRHPASTERPGDRLPEPEVMPTVDAASAERRRIMPQFAPRGAGAERLLEPPKRSAGARIRWSLREMRCSPSSFCLRSSAAARFLYGRQQLDAKVR